jgi:hypothetical protein
VFREIQLNFYPDIVYAERSANATMGWLDVLRELFPRTQEVMWDSNENDYWSKKQCAAASQMILKHKKACLHNPKLKTQMKEIEIKHLSKQTICPIGDDLHDCWLYASRAMIDYTGIVKAPTISVSGVKM